MEINKNKLGSQRGISGSQSGTIRTVIRRAGFPGCGISLANFLPQSMLHCSRLLRPADEAPFEQHNKI